jgi:hypothetical protein
MFGWNGNVMFFCENFLSVGRNFVHSVVQPPATVPEVASVFHNSGVKTSRAAGHLLGTFHTFLDLHDEEKEALS